MTTAMLVFLAYNIGVCVGIIIAALGRAASED